MSCICIFIHSSYLFNLMLNFNQQGFILWLTFCLPVNCSVIVLMMLLLVLDRIMLLLSLLIACYHCLYCFLSTCYFSASHPFHLFASCYCRWWCCLSIPIYPILLLLSCYHCLVVVLCLIPFLLLLILLLLLLLLIRLFICYICLFVIFFFLFSSCRCSFSTSCCIWYQPLMRQIILIILIFLSTKPPNNNKETPRLDEHVADRTAFVLFGLTTTCFIHTSVGRGNQTDRLKGETNIVCQRWWLWWWWWVQYLIRSYLLLLMIMARRWKFLVVILVVVVAIVVVAVSFSFCVFGSVDYGTEMKRGEEWNKYVCIRYLHGKRWMYTILPWREVPLPLSNFNFHHFHTKNFKAPNF